MVSTMNPTMTIYLDLDGVVNITATTEPELAGWTEQLDLFDRPGTDRDVRWCTYHPELVDRLNALAALEHVQIVLASAWQHDSRQLALTGLQCQDWEYLYLYEQHQDRQMLPEVLAQRDLIGGPDWKMWAMAAHQKRTDPTGQGRFLFIEDGPYLETREWIDSMPGGAYLSTDTALGITSGQMSAIEAACAPGAGQTEMDRVQSLSVKDGLNTLHEIYWVRGSYRPSDEIDLQRLVEKGFRPGQPRDMEVYHAWEQKYDEQMRRYMQERNLDSTNTIVL